MLAPRRGDPLHLPIRVDTKMPCQLVIAGEPAGAARECAHIWTYTCVGPHMACLVLEPQEPAAADLALIRPLRVVGFAIFGGVGCVGCSCRGRHGCPRLLWCGQRSYLFFCFAHAPVGSGGVGLVRSSGVVAAYVGWG